MDNPLHDVTLNLISGSQVIMSRSDCSGLQLSTYLHCHCAVILLAK